MRRLRKIRSVESLAKFAAIDLHLLAHESFDLLRIVVPALQVAAAELSFFVLFVARTLRCLLVLDLGGRGGRGFSDGGGRRRNSGCGLRRSFWSGRVGHSI